jgi:hypothetical protein
VISGDLVGDDAEPLGDRLAEEGGRKEASSVHKLKLVGRKAKRERPWVAAQCVGLRSSAFAHRLLGQAARNVVVVGDEGVATRAFRTVQRQPSGVSHRRNALAALLR